MNNVQTINTTTISTTNGQYNNCRFDSAAVTVDGDQNKLGASIFEGTLTLSGDKNRVSVCSVNDGTGIVVTGDDNATIGCEVTLGTIDIQSGDRNIAVGNSTDLAITDYSGSTSVIDNNAVF